MKNLDREFDLCNNLSQIKRRISQLKKLFMPRKRIYNDNDIEIAAEKRKEILKLKSK